MSKKFLTCLVVAAVVFTAAGCTGREIQRNIEKEPIFNQYTIQQQKKLTGFRKHWEEWGAAACTIVQTSVGIVLLLVVIYKLANSEVNENTTINTKDLTMHINKAVVNKIDGDEADKSTK
jgi:hypothetical protein